MPNPFRQPGKWLRGNLHAHTTKSDGPYSPQDTVEAYRRLGHDFLALTDHERCTEVAGLETSGMVLLPGAELGIPGGNLQQGLHAVALGIEEMPTLPQGATAAQALARLADQVPVCFLAHPFWSLLEAGEILPLNGYVGVEVFNTGCEREHHRGSAEATWDVLLAHGRATWGLAVDDGHHPEDFGGGWVAVKAGARTPEAVLQGLREGSFYSSQGPELRDLWVEGDRLHIACSPCVQAALVGARVGLGSATWYSRDLPRPFEETTLLLPADDALFRVEVIDAEGRKAWSNPFRREEME